MRIFTMKKLTMNIPDNLHRALKADCALRDTDMTQVIVGLIEGYLQKRRQQSIENFKNVTDGQHISAKRPAARRAR
jgi:hypothetical protein